MKKIEISDTVKDYIKKSVKYVILMTVFYSLTKWALFLFAALGYCIGAVVCCINSYRTEKYKETCLKEYEEELAAKIAAENIENEVDNNA